MGFPLTNATCGLSAGQSVTLEGWAMYDGLGTVQQASADQLQLQAKLRGLGEGNLTIRRETGDRFEMSLLTGGGKELGRTLVDARPTAATTVSFVDVESGKESFTMTCAGTQHLRIDGIPLVGHLDITPNE